MKLLFSIFLLCAGFTLEASENDLVNKIWIRSQALQSDSIVILHQDKPLLVYQSEESPFVDTMEMTKPLIALAFALLLDEGRISCLDTPIHYYYPTWNLEPYKSITLRHLLSNTSGIDSLCTCQNLEDPTVELLSSTSFYQPGTCFYKNPNAIRLLVDIVKIVSGKELGSYLNGKLFDPLGIENIFWRSGGTIESLPQFQMSAWDLAKIGTLMANDGKWRCKEIISKRRLDELLAPSQGFSPFFGLQWWLEFHDIAVWWDEELLNEYSGRGISQPLIDKLKSLQGQVIHFSGQVYGSQIVKLCGDDLTMFDNGRIIADLIKETHAKSLPMAKFKTGKLKMASAHGRGGQHLIIIPQHGLVAVRQRHIENKECSPAFDFDDLPVMLEELTKQLQE